MARNARRRTSGPKLEALEGRALLTAAGALDPSFGGGYGSAAISTGVSAIPTSAGYAVGVSSVVAVTGGKIEVGGTVGGVGTPSLIVTARLNADGSPDTSFGTDGLVTLPGSLVATVVQADGKTIDVANGIGSDGNPTFVAVRLNLDGSIDTSYGVGGIATYPGNSATPAADRLGDVTSAVLQLDGKLVLMGTAADPTTTTHPIVFAAARLDTDGTFDTAFGQGGTVDVPVTVNGITTDLAPVVALQPDGVILAGQVVTGTLAVTDPYPPPATELAVIRLTSTGTLDPLFGGPAQPGVVLIPPSLANPTSLGTNTATGLAVQPLDSKILISGAFDAPGPFLTGTSGNTLYRLNTDGTFDTSFGGTGLVNPTANGPMVVQADGEIVVSGAVRYSTDGTLDATFTPPTSAANGLGGSGQPLAIQGDGKLLEGYSTRVPTIPGLKLGLGVARLLPSPSTGAPALPAPPAPPNDFGGRGYSNPALYDPASGSLFYQAAPGLPFTVITYGTPGLGQTIPAVADYNGTGNDVLGAYLPASGTYEVDTYGFPSVQIGPAGAGNSIPAPGDYDGTGRAEIAVYVPSLASFVIKLNAVGSSGYRAVQFGTAGAGQSIPIPADYYGTGQDDVAVYLAAAGAFAVQDPTGATAGEIVPFGKPGLGQSIPVPGDYDGSGHVEFAVFIPSTATFYYRPYNGGPDVAVPFGTPGVGELPVVGDYDGSGRTEFAIYDPSRGFIAYRPAGGGPDVLLAIGTPNSGAIPPATPAGALPEFAAPGSGGGNAIVPPGSGVGSGSSNAVVVTQSRAVPSGPSTAGVGASITARLARSPINQAIVDPSKLTG